MKRSLALMLACLTALTTGEGGAPLFAQAEILQGKGEISHLVGESRAFEIPFDLGEVGEIYNPSASEAPFIIHIQDAHARPEIQEKIKEILEWWGEKEETLLVAVEGSSGPLHPEYLDLFPDFPEANEAVVKDLASKGELTGAELAAWKRYSKPSLNHDVRFVGVETPHLYRENLKTYRDLLFRRDEIDSKLNPYRKQLEVQRSKILSPELGRFLRERERRKEGNYGDGVTSPQLATYLFFLAAEVKLRLAVNLWEPLEQIRFPQFVRVLALSGLLKEFDPKKARAEKQKLLTLLRTRSRRRGTARRTPAIEGFFESFEESKVPRQMAESLWRFSARHSVSLAAYPSFLKSMGAVILQREIEGQSLLKEMERLERWIIDRLIKSEAERELVETIDQFHLLGKTLRLELTGEEYKKARALGLEDKFAATSPFFLEALHFYAVAERRDRALLHNALKAQQKSSAQRLVLITGGFHTEGLVQEMKGEGVGYAVIRPRVRGQSVSARELYHEVLRNGHADLTPYFPKGLLTKQEALLLKELTETATETLDKQYKLSDARIASALAEAVNRHPVLSKRLLARPFSPSPLPLPLKGGEEKGEGVGEANSLKSRELAIGETGLLTDPVLYSKLRVLLDAEISGGTVVRGPLTAIFPLRNARLKLVFRSDTRQKIAPPSRRSEARVGLTPAQRIATQKAAQAFGLGKGDRQYLIEMWKQGLYPDGSKRPLKIIRNRQKPEPDANFILGGHLTVEERERWLGAFEYEKLRKETAYREASKEAFVSIYSLDGGLGENLGRKRFKKELVRRGFLSESDVERDEKGETKLGAKGTDLGFFIKVKGRRYARPLARGLNPGRVLRLRPPGKPGAQPTVDGREVYVSIAEAKLLQLLNTAKQKKAERKFGGLALKPLVNKDSLPSYQKLLDRTYLRDRLDDTVPAPQKRTYRQILESAGIEILEPFLQQDIPAIEKEEKGVATTRLGVAQPGGHGQVGFNFLFAPEEWTPREDGLRKVLYFTNGDNLNASRLDEFVIGKMVRDRLPIIKNTTVATRSDKKGGKDGVKVVDLGGRKIYVPQQMEIADARGVGQEKIFTNAGQPEGVDVFGKESVENQPFNTNTIMILEDVLFPLLWELKQSLGEERYYGVMAPTRIKKPLKKGKDGKMYMPVDGAIGTVIHNLNEFVMTNEDPQVAAILERHGIPPDENGLRRILYFANVPRTPFFTPDKATIDHWVQNFSSYYRFNQAEWILEDSEEGLRPPLFEIAGEESAVAKDEWYKKNEEKSRVKGKDVFEDKYYDEYQNVVDSLGTDGNIVRLDSLTLQGRVRAPNATFVGDIKIVNETGRLVDLKSNAYRKVLKKLFKNGKLVLENVSVIFKPNGEISISSLARSENRKGVVSKPEMVNVAVIGLSDASLANAAVFAQEPNFRVTAIDDRSNLAGIRDRGGEPALQALIHSGEANGRLHFIEASDQAMEDAIRGNEVIYLDAGDPEGLDQHQYLTRLNELARQVGQNLRRVRIVSGGNDNRFRVFVLRGTVPIKTTEYIRRIINVESNYDAHFGIAYQPDFISKGKVVEDAIQNQIVIGLPEIKYEWHSEESLEAEDSPTWRILKNIVQPFRDRGAKLVLTSLELAEHSKQALVVSLTSKLALFMGLAPVVQFFGGDLKVVSQGIGLDRRIGLDRTTPNAVFGGRLSLWVEFIRRWYNPDGVPRRNLNEISKELDSIEDSLALHQRPERKYLDPRYLYLLWLDSLLASNDESFEFFRDHVEDILTRVQRPLKDSHVVLLGAAYKAGTDQITDSFALRLIEWLVEKGVTEIKIYDPLALKKIQAWIQQKRSVPFFSGFKAVNFKFYDQEPLHVMRDADFVFYATPLEELRELPPQEIKKALGEKGILVDGINLYGMDLWRPRSVTYKTLRDSGINRMGFGVPPLGPLFDKVTEGYHVLDSQFFPPEVPLPIQNEKPKSVAVFGSGYVGLVTGAILASLGHQVTVVDLPSQKERIENLNAAEPALPIYEPGLLDLIKKSKQEGRLAFTIDAEAAIQDNQIILVAVGTPQGDDGQVDLGYLLGDDQRKIEGVVRQFGSRVSRMRRGYRRGHPKILVVKSTVPPNAFPEIEALLSRRFRLEAGADYLLASIPEFLREGTAVEDSLKTDSTVIGVYSKMKRRHQEDTKIELIELMSRLRVRHPHPFLVTDTATSTAIKYGKNSLLAANLSETNLNAALVEGYESFYRFLRDILRNDPRIGPYAFRECGPGYGGSCFPKDVRALAYLTGRRLGHDILLIRLADLMNEIFKRRVAYKMTEALVGRSSLHGEKPLTGKHVGIAGLSFKANTDDVREASAVSIAAQLAQMGAEMVLYDPIFNLVSWKRRIEIQQRFKAEFEKKFPGQESMASQFFEPLPPKDIAQVTFTDQLETVFQGMDGVVVLNEWDELKSIDFENLIPVMNRTGNHNPVLMDGRGNFNAQALTEKVEALSFLSPGIGRPDIGSSHKTRSEARSVPLISTAQALERWKGLPRPALSAFAAGRKGLPRNDGATRAIAAAAKGIFQGGRRNEVLLAYRSAIPVGWTQTERQILGSYADWARPGNFTSGAVVRMEALPRLGKAWLPLLKLLSAGKLNLILEIEGVGAKKAARFQSRLIRLAGKFNEGILETRLRVFSAEPKKFDAESRRMLANGQYPVGLLSSDAAILEQYLPWVLRVNLSQYSDLENLIASIMITAGWLENPPPDLRQVYSPDDLAHFAGGSLVVYIESLDRLARYLATQA